MCWRLFKMLAQHEFPKNKYDAIYQYSNMDFSGGSFLLREDALIYNSYKHSTYDLCIYLALASLRPLAEYKANGKLTLDFIHARKDPWEYLQNPRLLRLENGQIHFLYEEVPSNEEL